MIMIESSWTKRVFVASIDSKAIFTVPLEQSTVFRRVIELMSALKPEWKPHLFQEMSLSGPGCN